MSIYVPDTCIHYFILKYDKLCKLTSCWEAEILLNWRKSHPGWELLYNFLCFEWGTSVWIKRYTYCILERKITTSHKGDSCYHFPVILCNSKWQECRLKNFLQIISFHFQNNTLNNCISNKVASFELLFMMTLSQSGIWRGSNISSLWTTWKSPPKSIVGTFPFLFKTCKIREIRFWNIFIRHWTMRSNVKGINQFKRCS